MSENRIITIDEVRPVIATKKKQFEAQLASIPEAGVIRPIGIDNWLGAVMADFARPGKQGDDLRSAAIQSPETVWECLSHAASVGLIPGSAGGKFYLIPRWNGRAQRVECTHIVGYKGMVELAYRHPRVHKVEAFVVMDTDEWEWNPLGQSHYRPDPKNSRVVEKDLSNIQGAIAVATLGVQGSVTLDPTPMIEWMTRDEIMAIRSRSEAAKRGRFSPWDSDPARMVRKCPLRRAANGGSLPQSDSLQIAIANENNEVERIDSESKAEVKQVAGGLREAVGLSTPTASVFASAQAALEFVRECTDAKRLGNIDTSDFSEDEKAMLDLEIKNRRYTLGGDDDQ